MQPLHFVEVHEDGRHLVLADPDSPDTEYLVEIDERLRAAVRTRPTASEERAQQFSDISPRRIQAMMRAGQSPEEIAEATGWDVERVRRFEAPIVAEREHVSDLARRAHVRGRATDGSVPTLEARVVERLKARGVNADAVRWDAIRPDGGSWTVLVTFVAGGRERTASWRFDPAGRTLEALDDEARWLSEDEQVLPGGADAVLGGARTAGLDLMASVRERSQARGRRSRRPSPADPSERRGGRRPRISPASVPLAHEPVPDELLPLEDLPYDPDTMGPPPAAGRPEEYPAGTAEDLTPEEAAEFQAAAEEAAEAEAAADQAEAEAAAQAEGAGQADAEGPQEATLEDFFGPEAVEEEARDDQPSVGPAAYELAEHPAAQDPEVLEAGSGAEASAGQLEAEAGNTGSEAGNTGSEAGNTGSEAENAGSEAEADKKDEPPAPPRKKQRKGRPSVPSWDDIMFGTRKA